MFAGAVFNFWAFLYCLYRPSRAYFTGYNSLLFPGFLFWAMFGFSLALIIILALDYGNKVIYITI